MPGGRVVRVILTKASFGANEPPLTEKKWHMVDPNLRNEISQHLGF